MAPVGIKPTRNSTRREALFSGAVSASIRFTRGWRTAHLQTASRASVMYPRPQQPSYRPYPISTIPSAFNPLKQKSPTMVRGEFFSSIYHTAYHNPLVRVLNTTLKHFGVGLLHFRIVLRCNKALHRFICCRIKNQTLGFNCKALPPVCNAVIISKFQGFLPSLQAFRQPVR